MKKTYLFIIILIAIVAFAASDYYANISIENGVIPQSEDVSNITITESDTNIVKKMLDTNPIFDYLVLQRSRTNELFGFFDLSQMDGIRIYKNMLKKGGDNTSDEDSIVIYEIQGESSQGKMTYLSLKLKVIDQLKPTMNINEVTNFGYNAFFYNDINNENTGFLVTQIKDNLYGFQYSKADDSYFDVIKNMIQALMDLNI